MPECRLAFQSSYLDGQTFMINFTDCGSQFPVKTQFSLRKEYTFKSPWTTSVAVRSGERWEPGWSLLRSKRNQGCLPRPRAPWGPQSSVLLPFPKHPWVGRTAWLTSLCNVLLTSSSPRAAPRGVQDSGKLSQSKGLWGPYREEASWLPSVILGVVVWSLSAVWLSATHALWSTSLLCPWGFPSKNSGVVAMPSSKGLPDWRWNPRFLCGRWILWPLSLLGRSPVILAWC